MECFLAEFLEEAPRRAPLAETGANLWLMNLDERLQHKGSFWSPPKPSICAHYQVMGFLLLEQAAPLRRSWCNLQGDMVCEGCAALAVEGIRKCPIKIRNPSQRRCFCAACGHAAEGKVAHGR